MSVNEDPGRLSATPDGGPRVTSVDVTRMPWAFTQYEPLSTGEFISQADRRGFRLDTGRLRQLYRCGLLVPFVYMTGRPVGPEPALAGPEPRGGGTLLMQLRYARDRGRLIDLGLQPFRPRLSFDKPDSVASHQWWNGLLYSKHQLLVLPQVESLLARATHRRNDQHFLVRLPEADHFLAASAARFRAIAIVLIALEARYLPALDPEWLQLTHGEPEEWERYRAEFRPGRDERPPGLSTRAATQGRGVPPAARALSRSATRSLDAAHPPCTTQDLGRPQRRRADGYGLQGGSRDPAAILRGPGWPRPDRTVARDGRHDWHPLHERLSCRDRSLDEDLVKVGLSPHPRVVLAVEGDTEYTHVPMVWKELDYPDAPELVRLLNLRGVDHDLEKVAALAATPLAGERLPPGRPGWRLIKPPTRLMIAVDPDGPRFGTPAAVAKTRSTIMKDVLDSLKDQGVTNPNPPELDALIDIRTWSQSCYEYAHFTDDELADAIMVVHHTIKAGAGRTHRRSSALAPAAVKTSSASGKAVNGTRSGELAENGSTRSAKRT